MAMTQLTTWKPVVQDSVRQLALDVVNQIAFQLRDPEHTLELTQKARSMREQSTGTPYRQSCIPFSVVDGHAALALFFGHLDRCFSGQGWDQVAHAYLVSAARSLETLPSSFIFPGLFGGLAGLCYATHYLSYNGTRYQRLLRTLDTLLFHHIADLIQPRANFSGARFKDYDVITGPSGIGAYLLERLDVQEVDPPLTAILTRLSYLSEYQEGELRFFIPPDHQTNKFHQEQNPQGCIDCGLAHGVPGPLAFLALACLQGIQWPGLKNTIRNLAEWLIAQQFVDQWGINWPYGVFHGTTTSEITKQSRPGWCYGSPAVARTLWLVDVHYKMRICSALLLRQSARYGDVRLQYVGLPVQYCVMV